MNLRLTIELLLRRHGWPTVLTVALLAAIPVVALLRATLPEAAPTVVLAADGSRQLDAHHRAFLATVLADQPALAIRDLSLRRAAAGNGVEAQLKLAFHTEMAPEARE